MEEGSSSSGSGRKGLQITLVSARNLEDVRRLFKMKVYAIVSIIDGSNYPMQKQQTPTDKKGQTNPEWNYKMSFNSSESGTLVIELYCQRLGKKDLCVGQFQSSIKELLNSTKEEGGGTVTKVFQLKKGSGNTIVSGELTFSYRFGQVSERVNNNVQNPKPSHMKKAFWSGVNTAVETTASMATAAGFGLVFPNGDDELEGDYDDEEADDDEEANYDDEEADDDDEEADYDDEEADDDEVDDEV